MKLTQTLSTLKINHQIIPEKTFKSSKKVRELKKL